MTKSKRPGNSHKGRHTARLAVCAEIIRRIVAKGSRQRSEPKALEKHAPSFLSPGFWLLTPSLI
jgi:hypothetical protein